MQDSEGKAVHASCPLCGALRRPLTCAKCTNESTKSARRALVRLRRKREGLFNKLAGTVKTKTLQSELKAQRDECLLDLQNSSERASAASDRHKQLRAQINSLQEKNKARQKQVDDAAAALLEKRRKNLQIDLPRQYRSQEVLCVLIDSELQREQARKICKLLEIFPLSIRSVKKDPSVPVRVTICNEKLPHQNDETKGKPKNLGVSLGYMLELFELMAFYSSGPQLHCSTFACSMSHIWQPQTCTDRDPPPLKAKLPLYISSQGRIQTSARLQDTGVAARQSELSDLESALHLLRRSIGAFTHSKLAPLGETLPENWGPFAWMAWLCRQVGEKPVERTWLGNTAVLKKDSQNCENMGVWTEELSQPLLDDQALQPATLLPDDEGMEDEWCHVARTTLPPPPSQDDDVLLYEQAHRMDVGVARQNKDKSNWSLLGNFWR